MLDFTRTPARRCILSAAHGKATVARSRSIAALRDRRDEILRIAARYGAHDVRVFGSVARNSADDNSDVDLLVRLEPRVTLLMHAALVRELRHLLGRKVDIVSDRGLRPRVRERIEREAVHL